MIFQNLKLVNFKNFNEASVVVGPGFQFVTGSNGAGKTNFLDAIYYLCMGKNFRKTKDADLINHQSDFFRIEAIVSDDFQNNSLSIKFKHNVVKEINWNDKKSDKLSDHIGKIPVVLITPDEIYQLIHESEERRKFMNQTLIQIDPIYLDHLNIYTRFLRQRNAALKLMKKSGRLDGGLLDIYDLKMADSSKIIATRRNSLIQQLTPLISDYSKQISGKDEKLSLEYHSKVDERFEEKLFNSRALDFQMGVTHMGIHKDKLDCLMDNRPLSQVGSQGQIKTFVLALKLAQFDYLKNHSKQLPVVLLDDIFAKLDTERIQKLLMLLESENIQQCFITDTHFGRVKELAKSLTKQTAFYQILNNQCTIHE